MLIQERDVQQVANAMMNMLHEDEVELINQFYDAIKAKDIEKIDELFHEVLAELEAHFTTEEDVMQQSAYPQMQMHKNDHNVMRKKLDKIYKRWEVLKDPNELQDFLDKEYTTWYAKHVSKWDEKTALYIGDF